MAFRQMATLFIAVVCVAALVMGCGDQSSTVAPTSTTSEAPMVAPTGLSIAVQSNGWHSLIWSANTQPHLAGYNIYRIASNQSGIEKLNSSLLTNNAFADTDVESRVSYEYWVTAVSAKGAESAYSIPAGVDAHPSDGVKEPAFQD